MKEQTRIDFCSRKIATRRSSQITQNKVVDSEITTKAFRPAEEVLHKPTKVEKHVRKSGRIASKSLEQTILILEKDDKVEKEQVCTQKRKSSITPKNTTKKQKPNNSSNVTTNTVKEVTKEPVFLKDAIVPVVKDVEQKGVKKTVVVDKIDKVVVEEVVAKGVDPVITTEKRQDIIDTVTIETTHNKEEPANIVNTPIEEEEEPVDSPSPPSFLTEPSTPPTHLVTAAPYKTYLTQADKERIEREILTLEKLRKVLDITITDRMARNRPALYHQIEPVLRNSTGKNITLSHICKVMYIAPKLYTLEAKELRDFGNKVTEAFLIQFGKGWEVPLAGKDLQRRSDILKYAIKEYFDIHGEPDATIPEIKLPKLSLVVDKKEWVNKVNLPPGVKSLLKAHEKAKAAEIESQKPKPKPVGSVKDRMAALRARLAEKKSS